MGPELPVPTPIEEATEAADGDEAGAPVDAPALPDGDDAGDVAGPAADDDLSEPGAADGDRGADDSDRRADDGDRRADDAAGVARAAAAAIPAQSVARRASAAAAGAPETRTDDDGGLDGPPLDDAELRAALEAILLVVDEPVAEMQLAQIMEQPTERVAAMLEDISARYTAAGHGFDLRRAAGGWRLYTRPEYAAYVERFVLDGQSVRLTQAALETLAVVAYKQPVTRSRISAIRGVNCDGVMRTLATRGLIEECGTEPETGAHLYRTTALFLEKLGLNSVDQLPPLAPFLPDDVEEVLDASG
ncbi:MAG TPA: SMC-Scp complex subunit ScpB [Actinoplanes sp.]|nr:SMC-Scp complex subunit ScpB [Actinoplanes sp.]